MCNVEGPPLKKRRPQFLPEAEPYPIYLDTNATTALCAEAWDAMCKVQNEWGNPSSSHPYGLAAKHALDLAREQVARAIAAPSSENIIFTSGGTESNNLAIISGAEAVRRADPSRRVIVSTNVEHPAVLQVLKHLQHRLDPFDCVLVPVSSVTGQLSPTTLREALLGLPHGPHSVALVTMMYANNELGSVNDIGELSRIIKEVCGESCLVHSDAAQALGKVPVQVVKDGIDLLSICSHKFYGPKGMGALYCKAGVVLHNQLYGAGHEGGIRPGTENVLLATGMGVALLHACQHVEEYGNKMRATRDELVRVLRQELTALGMDLVINGSIEVALPNTLNCAIFKKVPDVAHGLPHTFISAQRLILSIGDQVCMSAGSACHATAGEGETIEVSEPLKAVGVDLTRAIGTLRLSTGRCTTIAEARRAARIIARHAAQQFAE